MPDNVTPKISIENRNFRQTYTQHQFEELNSKPRLHDRRTLKQKLTGYVKNGSKFFRVYYCGVSSDVGVGTILLKFIYGLFPFIDIMRNYEVKNWLANDLIAGLTTAVMHVPQGMAYAMLASLPPVYGLYCSIIGPFVYFFMGTSRQLSIGTLAVISILVGSCLDGNLANLSPLTENNDTSMGYVHPTQQSSMENIDTANRVGLATVLAVTVGLIQMMMGFLRLGFLTQLLSQPMLSAFTVGASVHVGISQLFVVFGLHLKKSTGIFNVLKNFYSICTGLPQSNFVTLGLSLACMAILYIFLIFINPPLTKRIKVPVPIELLTIIFGGVVSYHLRLRTEYNVKTVGTVPTGFPKPMIPDISRAGPIVGDAFLIALIGFAISYSLASFNAHKEGYKVDPNQELIAFGVTNTLGSFFQTYPMAASISRTALVASMGGKTQLVGITASLIVLLVVLFAGPLFYDLPNCCLSAIILVALRGMFTQVIQLRSLWRKSIWDFASWVITLLATVFLDVIYGLIIGILFSAFTVFIRAQLPHTSVLGLFEETEIFQPLDTYINCSHDPRVRVVRYEGAIFYAGTERFASSIFNASGLDPRPIVRAKRKLDKIIKELDLSEDGEVKDPHQTPNVSERSDGESDTTDGGSMTESDRRCGPCYSGCRNCNRSGDPAKMKKNRKLMISQFSELLNTIHLKYLILDCSGWNFIDLSGVNCLKLLILDYNSVGVLVYLAALSRSTQTSMLRCGLFEDLDQSFVFISVYDAYASVLEQIRRISVDEIQDCNTDICTLEDQF